MTPDKRAGLFPLPPVFSDQEGRRVSVLCAGLALFLALLTLPIESFFLFGSMKAGEKSDRNITALRNYFVTDSSNYVKRKEKVRRSMPLIIDADSELMDDKIDYLEQAFSKLRNWTRSHPYDRNYTDDDLVREGQALLTKTLEIKEFPRDSFNQLWSAGFPASLEREVKEALDAVVHRGYMDANAVVDLRKKIIKRILPDYDEVVLEEINFIYGVEGLKKFSAGWIEKSGSETLRKQGKSFSDLVVLTASPTMFFNQQETERREKELLRKVLPVQSVIGKGELVVGKGELLLPATYEKIQAMEKEELSRITPVKFLHNFIFYLLFTFLFYIISVSSIKKFLGDFKSIIFAVLIVSLTTVFSVLFYWAGISLSFNNNFYPFALVLFVPFALSGMLLRLFLNSETAVIQVLFMAMVMARVFNDNHYIMFYATATAMVGIHLIGHYYKRSEILKSGFKIGLSNLVILLLVIYVTGESSLLFANKRFMVIGGVFLSGIVSSILILALTPLLEHLFGYTTNIRLLELSDVEHPLLKDLMLKAPGTYNHSILIGNLVELAAQAIRVNPLLARVSAYYHDIGKISMPDSFIENQTSDYNKHEDLSPSMSVIILSAHVREGIELARKHNLGEPIVNAIAQHHGTRLMTFFYAKALTADPGADETAFRYPGPKPKTREVGLVMMADAVEAACRVLEDPTPSRLGSLVRKIVNDIFIDGQLDECELTLKDLNLVTESFTTTLMGIYHHRVDYPDLKRVKKNGDHRKPE